MYMGNMIAQKIIYMVYRKNELGTTTLGVRKDKLNVTYCIGHILST